jgi:uncharacterized protein (TIGR02147 family)
LARTQKPKKSSPPERPDAFRYHDYRSFLKDWFGYLKQTQPRFSLRSLAAEAQLATGHLPMMLAGKRSLSRKVFVKLAPLLHLSPSELKHLENLVQLDTEDSLQLRVLALQSMRRSFTYKKRHPNEVEFFEYMARWYHIVIREMSTLDGFRADPQWIRDKLKWKLPLGEIRVALDFLIQKKYLELTPEGSVVPAKDSLSCEDRVFSTVLKQYHKQMFNLAADSMENTPADHRELHGYTFAINSSEFESAQKIVREALEALQQLEKKVSKPRDSIYHMQLALFTLTSASPAEESLKRSEK